MTDMEETIRLSAGLIQSIKKLNKIEDEKKPIELRAFVGTICNLYRGLSFENFSIANMVQEGLTVQVNELVLYNALANVIKNAIEASNHSPTKKIIIESSKKEESHIFIDVSDFGWGVSESARKELFAGVSSKADGSGYGLKNSRERLRLTGGDLELINAQNPTTFRITLGVL